MPMLSLALFSGAGAFLYVAWGSWVGGYPPELALLRGVVGFVAMSLFGFVAELTISSVRSRPASGQPAQREPTPMRTRIAPMGGEAKPPDETQRAA